MKPKLYSPGTWMTVSGDTFFEKKFIGVLSDALSCKVTRAMDTEYTYSLEMTYPVGGAHFSSIQCRGIITAKPDLERGEQMFEIYRITTPIDGVITVYGKHISYMLASIPAPEFTEPAKAADALKTLKAYSNSVFKHGFTFSIDSSSEILSSSAEMKHEIPTSLRAALMGSEGSFIDTFGGEIEFDNFNVTVRDKIGKKSITKIKYGINMTDFERDENMTNVYTGLYPYASVIIAGDDGSTITNVVTIPSKIIYASDNPDYKKVKVVDLTSKFTGESGVTAEITPENLLEAAREYISENQWGIPNVNIKVSFISLAQTQEYKGVIGIEDICYGDTVTVEYPAVGISASARCVKTVYDCIGDKYETIEVGKIKKSIVDTIATLKQDVRKARR